MKRTTYIMIGILVTVLLVLVTGVIYISFQKSEPLQYGPVFPDKTLAMDCEGIQVVKVHAADTCPVRVEGDIIIIPSRMGKAQFTYPESEYLTVSRKADTLVVYLDFHKWKTPRSENRNIIPIIYAENLHLQLEAGSNLLDVSSTVPGLDLKIKGFQADTLNLSPYGAVAFIDSCSVRALSVNGAEASLVAENSILSYLYLDLDGVRQWNVSNCAIDTEYLTGSGRHNNNLQKGECKQMFWSPKTEDAELAVTMNEKGCLVVQP